MSSDNNLDHENEEKFIDDPDSTWGGRFNDLMIPPITLQRYYKFQQKINRILFIFLILLMIAMFGMFIKFLFFHEYQFLLFSDGTDFTCIFNPSTGEMKQNVK